MLRTMCKGKIHRATVTEANLNYIGSITVDQDLLDAANIYPYEKVQVVNLNNGSRLETYTIAGARLTAQGDQVIIISYAQYTEEEVRTLVPHIAFVDDENRLTEKREVPLSEMLPDVEVAFS